MASAEKSLKKIKKALAKQIVPGYISEVCSSNQKESFSNMKNEHTIPAVEKTIVLLEYLAQQNGSQTHAQLAQACGITASTCYRILRSLMKYGWICKEPDGTFSLSGGLLPLSLRVASLNGENWENIQPILENLAAETGLSCKLSIRKGELEQYVLARAEAPGPFSISGKPGATFPIVEGSVGAALLADSLKSERTALLRAVTADIPEKKDRTLLERSVDAVQQQGYILNTDHNRWRIGALSVPLRDRTGKIAAALTLLGVADDFTPENLPRLLKALAQAQKQFLS